MRIVTALLLASTLAAADGEPLVTISVPDGARLRDRFAASIFGKVWNDPAAATWRSTVIEAMDAEAADLGFKPSELFASFRFAGMDFLALVPGEREPTPTLRAITDFADATPAVFALLAQEGTATDVPGSDGAFAIPGPDLPGICARFGSALVATIGPEIVPAVWAPAASDEDMLVQLDSRRVMEAVIAAAPQSDQDELRAFQAAAKDYQGPLSWTMSFVPEGVHEVWKVQAPALWLVSVDRPLLNRLPATTLTSLAIGLDGDQLWSRVVMPVITVLADQDGESLADIVGEIDADLSMNGIPVGIEDLIRSYRGTTALWMTPSAPFPAWSLVAPRSEGIDAVVALAIADLGIDPPDTGMQVILPIPGFPVPVTLACDEHHWLVTSDSAFVAGWLAGTPGGYLESPAAKAALAIGGEGTMILGSSDTGGVLRTMTPFIALGMGQMVRDAEDRQTVMNLLAIATKESGSGYVVVRPEDGGLLAEARGIITWGSYLPMIAAIAIPNLIQSRQQAQRMAAVTAATRLRHSFLPAQIQFQSGAYADEDGDGIGAFGFPEEMAGGANPAGIAMSLLPPDFVDHQPVVGDYQFTVYLPDGAGGMVSNQAERLAKPAGAEDNFVVYACPVTEVEGQETMMYAMSANGLVYAAAWEGTPPAWNALWGDDVANAWVGQPVWAPAPR